MLNAIINMSGRTKPQFFGIFPTAHINDCFEQTSIWAVSGSHRSTAHINGTHCSMYQSRSKLTQNISLLAVKLIEIYQRTLDRCWQTSLERLLTCRYSLSEKIPRRVLSVCAASYSSTQSIQNVQCRCTLKAGAILNYSMRPLE